MWFGQVAVAVVSVHDGVQQSGEGQQFGHDVFRAGPVRDAVLRGAVHRLFPLEDEQAARCHHVPLLFHLRGRVARIRVRHPRLSVLRPQQRRQAAEMCHSLTQGSTTRQHLILQGSVLTRHFPNIRLCAPTHTICAPVLPPSNYLFHLAGAPRGATKIQPNLLTHTHNSGIFRHGLLVCWFNNSFQVSDTHTHTHTWGKRKGQGGPFKSINALNGPDSWRGRIDRACSSFGSHRPTCMFSIRFNLKQTLERCSFVCCSVISFPWAFSSSRDDNFTSVPARSITFRF